HTATALTSFSFPSTTSFPSRSTLFPYTTLFRSHFGMAREVAAISGGRLLDPVKMNLLPKGKCPINIAIQDFELCLRYSALERRRSEDTRLNSSHLGISYAVFCLKKKKNKKKANK